MKAMTRRKFYRTIIKVEVLHEDPRVLAKLEGLDEVHALITDGPCSGFWNVTRGPTEMNGLQTARLLLKQGSDPEFFSLDERGNDAA